MNKKKKEKKKEKEGMRTFLYLKYFSKDILRRLKSKTMVV